MLVVVTALTAIFGLVAGDYWLTQRVAVGSARHALNFQEATKDIFTQSTREACRHVNSGKVWIRPGDPRYAHDRHAASADVYRYIVLDSQTLQDSSCLNAFVATAARAPYSTLIAFSDKSGLEIANFFFFKEQK